jgi:hypothetical protein
VENGSNHASQKKIEIGGQGVGVAPLGCLPLWGREGVILAIALNAFWEGSLQSPKNNLLKER